MAPQAANPATLRYCNLHQRGLVLHHVTHARWHAEFHFVSQVCKKRFKNYVGAGAHGSAACMIAKRHICTCMMHRQLQATLGGRCASGPASLLSALFCLLWPCSLRHGAGEAGRAAQGRALPGEALTFPTWSLLTLCQTAKQPLHAHPLLQTINGEIPRRERPKRSAFLRLLRATRGIRKQDQ